MRREGKGEGLRWIDRERRFLDRIYRTIRMGSKREEVEFPIL
jgi:hypothetical protein